MKDSSKVSYRQIAESVGVSVATVTRAMKNDPHVKPATRERVLEAAKRMGYEPDPDMGRLMRRLRSRQREAEPETIAYLQHLHPKCWGARSADATMLQGCRAAAESLGYHIDPIRLPEPPGKGFDRVLQSRGIRGLIIETFAPDPFPWTLQWEHYATVTLGTRPEGCRFHCIGAAAYESFGLALKELPTPS